MILFLSLLLVNFNQNYALENTKAIDIKNNNTKHNDLFEQDVKMYFYENIEQCLNNDIIILKTHNTFDIDCTCLNTSNCLTDLFTSNDFSSLKWNLSGNIVNGSECKFKYGSICDTCGEYAVKTDIILFGTPCINESFARILLTLFIMLVGISLSVGCVYFIFNNIQQSGDGVRRFRRRNGYSSINNTDKPPSYN